jgi:hypothetical protein
VEKKEGEDSLFSYNGFGYIVLTRKQFVKKWCDIILNPQDIKRSICSHYFRSPYGNGKTSFLMLLGKELSENRNCSVYFINSVSELDLYKEESFRQARNEALKENKTLVIMIDEVQMNFVASRWVYLLKNATATVVVGTGIPSLTGSPQFVKKYQPSEMNFDYTSEDMEELIDVFVKQTESRDISREVITDICQYICEYTGGHMFPMLKFCEHIFDIAQNNFLDDYSKYLTSKTFYDNKDYLTVRERCFDSLPFAPICGILQGGTKNSNHIFELDKLGLWSSKKHWFISKCLVDVIYNSISKDERILASKISFKELSVEAKIETIINGGLEHMSHDDFQ